MRELSLIRVSISSFSLLSTKNGEYKGKIVLKEENEDVDEDEEEEDEDEGKEEEWCKDKGKKQSIECFHFEAQVAIKKEGRVEEGKLEFRDASYTSLWRRGGCGRLGNRWSTVKLRTKERKRREDRRRERGRERVRERKRERDRE